MKMYREITGYKSISIAIFSTFLYIFRDFGFCSVFSADLVRMTRSFQRNCFQLPCNSCRRNVIIIEEFLHSWHFHKKQLFKKLENKTHVWKSTGILVPAHLQNECNNHDYHTTVSTFGTDPNGILRVLKMIF